jgi:hypothetical protein
MNEQELARIANRAARVKELTNSDWFLEAVSAMHKSYSEASLSGVTLDAREEARRMARLLNRLVTDLKSMINDGAFAEKRLKELEGQKGGLRKIFG